MGPLDDENKLQVGEKNNKNSKKFEKISKKYNIKNFMTIRYKLTASSNTIHSMFNYKLMR